MGLQVPKEGIATEPVRDAHPGGPGQAAAPAGELGRDLSQARLAVDRRRTVRAFCIARTTVVPTGRCNRSGDVLLLKEMFALTGVEGLEHGGREPGLLGAGRPASTAAPDPPTAWVRCCSGSPRTGWSRCARPAAAITTATRAATSTRWRTPSRAAGCQLRFERSPLRPSPGVGGPARPGVGRRAQRLPGLWRAPADRGRPHRSGLDPDLSGGGGRACRRGPSAAAVRVRRLTSLSTNSVQHVRVGGQSGSSRKPGWP